MVPKTDKHTRRLLLYGVGGCVLLFGALLALAYECAAAREFDVRALQGFFGLQRPSVYEWAKYLATAGHPLVVALSGVLLAGVALLRGRPHVAVTVILLIAATSVSSQVLKVALAYPRYRGAETDVAAFPSGHATAVMTLAIAAVMVAPPRVRALAGVVGGCLAAAVGLAVISRGAHFPSDVAGGFLLAAGWGFAAVAGLRIAAQRYPQRAERRVLMGRVGIRADSRGGSLAAAAAAAAVVLGVAGVAFLSSVDLAELVRNRTAAVLVVIGLVLLALVLLGSLVSAVRRREQDQRAP